MASNSATSSLKPNLIKRDSSDHGINSSTMVKIKTEQNVDIKSIKPERLSSFRLPRDLTLGGLPTPRNMVKSNLSASNANKKVYIPNLNAVRNKNV